MNLFTTVFIVTIASIGICRAQWYPFESQVAMNDGDGELSTSLTFEETENNKGNVDSIVQDSISDIDLLFYYDIFMMMILCAFFTALGEVLLRRIYRRLDSIEETLIAESDKVIIRFFSNLAYIW